MRLVLLADTHGYHAEMQVPDADVLIHAGDFTRRGGLDEVRDFDDWLAALPHPHKIVIAGNHDWAFQETPSAARAALAHATYLQDEAVEIDGVLFWGSPWQPRFMDWAFNLDRGAPLAEKWALIPSAVDVLITHGPPYGILDVVRRGHVGCEALRERLTALHPRLHVFGHIHETPGIEVHDQITFVNAATDFARHPARVVEI